MCGISGIININGEKVDYKDIKKITDLIRHRGPDNEGFYFDKNFAFGHRRLSIIDLSSHGNQPMQYNNYIITYNGEIYNYLELKEELKADGYTFTSNTDTEVILAAYDKWKENCVDRFNGMWAFAIYDKSSENIFCSRDRYGIKPFYYTLINDKFIFGSEIKQLLEYHNQHYVNTNVLLDYLIADIEEHTDNTFFEGIKKLRQSHNLIYDLKTNKYEIYRYYKLNTEEKSYKNEEVFIEKAREKLKTSISLRLRSDVKVGTSLSGGLDSSSVAAIASKLYLNENTSFVAIHARSVEKETDESTFAKTVADYCNLDLKIVTPQLDDITKLLDNVIYAQEEPFGSLSVFMQFMVMQKAKEIGCKVMLDGQGGDETLFGYEFYYSIYLADLLKRYKIRSFLKELGRIKTFKFSKIEIAKRIVIALSFNIRKIFYYYRKKHLGLACRYDTSRLKYLFTFDSVKDFQKKELCLRKLPHLLKYEDKNSMFHSVETRLPFIDYLFVQEIISVNDRLKFKSGYLKYILRKIIEGSLPDSIVWRTNKFGFESPAKLWIAANKELMISAIKNSVIINNLFKLSPKIYKNHKFFWKLYNISVWEKRFNVVIKESSTQ